MLLLRFMCEIIFLQDFANISYNPLHWVPILKYYSVKIKTPIYILEHYLRGTFTV